MDSNVRISNSKNQTIKIDRSYIAERSRNNSESISILKTRWKETTKTQEEMMLDWILTCWGNIRKSG